MAVSPRLVLVKVSKMLMRVNVLPAKTFSKQTSKAASASEVKTVLCSPATSLGLPYSLPTASII